MARPQTIKQHQDIRKEFERLSNIKEFGVRKHTSEWIFNKLAEQFYKSPVTIEDIVFGRTKDSAKLPQPTLFSQE